MDRKDDSQPPYPLYCGPPENSAPPGIGFLMFPCPLPPQDPQHLTSVSSSSATSPSDYSISASVSLFVLIRFCNLLSSRLSYPLLHIEIFNSSLDFISFMLIQFRNFSLLSGMLYLLTFIGKVKAF